MFGRVKQVAIARQWRGDKLSRRAVSFALLADRCLGGENRLHFCAAPLEFQAVCRPLNQMIGHLIGLPVLIVLVSSFGAGWLAVFVHEVAPSHFRAIGALVGLGKDISKVIEHGPLP